jgi:hypothetical protein
MQVTAASGGPLLFDQYAPSAILTPKNRKTETHSAWSQEALAGRFLILGVQLFVGALCRGGKPQRGRRILLNIDHIIIVIGVVYRDLLLFNSI